MYRRPKFLEVLLEIRQEMARDADYDVDLFAEMVRSGKIAENEKIHALAESSSSEEKIKSEIKINR
jgi:hypothetical protein